MKRFDLYADAAVCNDVIGPYEETKPSIMAPQTKGTYVITLFVHPT